MYEAIGSFTYQGRRRGILLNTGLPYMANLIGLSTDTPDSRGD